MIESTWIPDLDWSKILNLIFMDGEYDFLLLDCATNIFKATSY